MRGPLHSSNSDEWPTPQWLFDELSSTYGPFDLDAAATPTNAKAASFYTAQADALTRLWSGRVWCNPPYSKAAKFVEHAIRQTVAGHADSIVLLVPARTDTVWFREAIEHADEVRFLSGRIVFEGATQPAPFPSCVIVLRSRLWRSNSNERYTMPTRHGSRPLWYRLKLSCDGPADSEMG